MKHKRTSRCHCINLRRANAAVTAYYDRMLEPLGLTVSQYSLLVNLSRTEPTSISSLAATVGLERTTLSRSLRPLFSAALIEDVSEPGRRDRRMRLTDKGRQTVEAGALLWEKAQRGVKKHLGAERLKTFLSILSDLESI